jgi:hypothetical protein
MFQRVGDYLYYRQPTNREDRKMENNINKTQLTEIIGKKILGVQGEKGDEELFIYFLDTESRTLRIDVYEEYEEYIRVYHRQDCCDTSEITQIDGKLTPGSEIKDAYVVWTSYEEHEDRENSETPIWTFLHIRTDREDYCVRFHSDNGPYYSDGITIDYCKVKKEEFTIFDNQ